jgi:hypothetical protein
LDEDFGLVDHDVELHTIVISPSGSVLTENAHGYGSTDSLTQLSPSRKRSKKNCCNCKNIKIELSNIWSLVQLKSVWRPMIFVFVFRLFQVSNIAWQSYLQLDLHYSPWILGCISTMGSIMTFVGVLLYKYYFLHISWRKIYILTAGMKFGFHLLNLILIFQWNEKYFHMSNYFFSVGDEIVIKFISGA